MDTLSYALGIGTVVNVAIGVVAIVALVKAQKANKENGSLQRVIELNHTYVHDRIDHVFNELSRLQHELDSQVSDAQADLHNRIDDVISLIDSKCDKLENKLINAKK